MSLELRLRFEVILMFCSTCDQWLVTPHYAVLTWRIGSTPLWVPFQSLWPYSVMHTNSAGPAGVFSGRVKVTSLSLGAWINCSPEVFHLPETENIHFAVWPRGGCFLPPQDGTMLFLNCGSSLDVHKMTWKSEINSPNFLFPFQTSQVETRRDGSGASMCLTTQQLYTYSHMNLLIASL